MSRKCPECLESGRAHLPTCSYGPDPNERAAFIREHAVDLVRDLEEKVRRQAKKLSQDGRAIRIYQGAHAALLERVAKLRDALRNLLSATALAVDTKAEHTVWEAAAKVLRDEGVEVGSVDDASDWIGGVR